ncbi:RNA polymerase subunit sigma-70 [Actinosynnema sp. NPDC053489]|uniref:RNA polymerase subunit sigma-70 n=1 Tax=Actinosynnema sp. NPDC053489 TaxID=3363916 RepID=UPI0037C644B3
MRSPLDDPGVAHPAADLLGPARAGDGEAFRRLVAPHRRELHVHCYRLLGSTHDAEDVVQETLLAAWRGIDGFAERSSVRTWLYRIATNRCLNALRSRARRPGDHVAHPPVPMPEPTHRAEPGPLEPYPDALLDELADRRPGPESRYEVRESVSLAFLTALHRLPPRQRTALVLRDVLGFRAAEVAGILDTTENAVAAALKRARGALTHELPADRDRAPLPRSPGERRIVADFTRAFESGDVEAVVALLTDDVRLTMPPLPLEYRTPQVVGRFLAAVALCGGVRRALLPTRANGQPAFGYYAAEPGTTTLRARGLLVLTLAGERITALTRFHDDSHVDLFGLPRALRPEHHPGHGL